MSLSGFGDDGVGGNAYHSVHALEFLDIDVVVGFDEFVFSSPGG